MHVLKKNMIGLFIALCFAFQEFSPFTSIQAWWCIRLPQISTQLKVADWVTLSLIMKQYNMNKDKFSDNETVQYEWIKIRLVIADPMDSLLLDFDLRLSHGVVESFVTIVYEEKKYKPNFHIQSSQAIAMFMEFHIMHISWSLRVEKTYCTLHILLSMSS